MAHTPTTIRVTHDELAKEIEASARKLIDLAMALRKGFDVPVTFAAKFEAESESSGGVEDRVAEVVAESQRAGKSDDPLVQIAWLIHGLDIWHRTGGRVGHTLTETVEYVTRRILRRRFDHADESIAELADRIAELASRITPSWQDVLDAEDKEQR